MSMINALVLARVAPQGFRPGLRTVAPIRGLKTGQPAVLVAAERRPCLAQGGSPGQRAEPQSEAIAPPGPVPCYVRSPPSGGSKPVFHKLGSQTKPRSYSWTWVK